MSLESQFDSSLEADFGKNRRPGNEVSLSPSPPLAFESPWHCFAPTHGVLSSYVPIIESGFLLGFQLLRVTAALAI